MCEVSQLFYQTVNYLHRWFEMAFMCPYGCADRDVSAVSHCGPDVCITISVPP